MADDIPQHLLEIVPQTLDVVAPDWTANYALQSAKWNYIQDALGPPMHFSQIDPRWKTEKLGSSLQTIGGWGCAMVCACMVYSRFEPSITPLEFNNILTRNGGYNYVNGEAHLAWERLPAIFPALKWQGRTDWNRRLTTTELDAIKAKIAIAPLVLWVDFKPSTDTLNTHFVLATLVIADDIQIIDSYDGEVAWLLKRYAKAGQDLQRAIWGYREIVATTGVG